MELNVSMFKDAKYLFLVVGSTELNLGYVVYFSCQALKKF